MQTLFLPCPMCGSLEHDFIQPALLADGSHCCFQKIWLCKKCGLVFKNPVIPERNAIEYSPISWDGTDAFREGAELLGKRFGEYYAGKKTPRTIFEIGPGPGFFSNVVAKLFPEASLFLFEPSASVAAMAAENVKTAQVFPSAFDAIENMPLKADLIIANGVDYLFPNHHATMSKIHAYLESDGTFFVERSVFTNTTGYVGFPIKSKKAMFGQNVLMTTWFHPEQYAEYLSKCYSIQGRTLKTYPVSDGVEGEIYGFFCQKTQPQFGYYIGEKSWYSQNKDLMDALSNE